MLLPDEPHPESVHPVSHEVQIEKQIKTIRSRLMQEAASAIGMVESAVDALMRLDVQAARAVMGRDDEVDREEVRIEEECFRLLTLFNPVARDFREVATMLKVNGDLERVADHATSVAKQTVKLAKLGVPQWPTSLQELTQRVPMMCHALLAALQRDDAVAARAVMNNDEAIDKLVKRLFEEAIETMGDDRNSKAVGMLMYRCGRELERIGDLMKNIAEDLIYLVTGSIVRHEAKQARSQAPE
ncbi:MAG: phosphate signaling complex protein PhoU [Phycisphaerae bacterium]|nr:phosphate signaling complex protein PhoU [Phycisphaerae bacterium]